MIDGIPLPARDGPFEQGFWDALDKGVLAHQQCASCGKWTFPPRWRCLCGGALQYRPVSGKGRLWSWTQVHAPVLPAFAPLTPYIAAIVELEEQSDLRMAGMLVRDAGGRLNAVTLADLYIGMKLETVIAPLGSGVNWPQWKTLHSFTERQSHD